jgi:hypothetical protein
VVTFATAITACGARSEHSPGATPARWRQALQLLELMERRGVRPDAHCLCAAIAVRRPWARPCPLRLRPSRARCLPVWAVPKVCAKGGAWDEALKLLGSLEARHIEPTEVVFGTALDACVRAGKHDEAMEVKGLKGQITCPPIPHVIALHYPNTTSAGDGGSPEPRPLPGHLAVAAGTRRAPEPPW